MAILLVKLLNGRQIKRAIDVLIPSPAHQAQERQSKQAEKAAQRLARWLDPQYPVGTPCYALYCGLRRDKDPRWVPAVVTKVRGARSVSVRVYQRGQYGGCMLSSYKIRLSRGSGARLNPNLIS